MNEYGDVKRKVKDRAKVCRACVFGKPGLRVKKGQSIEEFLQEVRCDIEGGVDWKGKERVARPEKYYRWEQFSLGRAHVMAVGRDIEQEAADLKAKYDRAGKGQLLDPGYWPRRENKCFEWAGCEYQQLCLHPVGWRAYVDGFGQRDMLYDIERDELE